MITVHIWYGDGRHESGAWVDLPDHDVQVIAWCDDHGGITWAWGVDEYHDAFDSNAPIKYGAWMTDDDFLALWTKARTELG